MSHHMVTVAIRKSGIEGWEPFYYKRIGTDGILIKGGIPRLLIKGPRKGNKTWDRKDSTSVVVTDSEIKAEEKRYSEETGNCAECCGEGKTVSSWSITDGTKYKPCKPCAGTGKNAAAAAA